MPCAASGMAWTILRPTWVYGPGDVSLNRFLGFARTLPFVPLTNLGRQQLAPVFVGDVARLAADSLEQDAAVEQVFEVGGPEAMSMREVIGRAMAVAGMHRPLMPGPTPLIKLAAWPMRFLPHPPLSPDAVDFVNQPATVDIAPLLRPMPRTLTPLEVGLATYLGPQRPRTRSSTARGGPAPGRLTAAWTGSHACPRSFDPPRHLPGCSRTAARTWPRWRAGRRGRTSSCATCWSGCGARRPSWPPSILPRRAERRLAPPFAPTPIRPGWWCRSSTPFRRDRYGHRRGRHPRPGRDARSRRGERARAASWTWPSTDMAHMPRGPCASGRYLPGSWSHWRRRWRGGTGRHARAGGPGKMGEPVTRGTAADILSNLVATQLQTGAADARRYLTETVGLVPGRAAQRHLERTATDASEDLLVRLEAIASLGDRATEPLPASVGRLAADGGRIGEAVASARAMQMLRHRGARHTHDRAHGLKVAQVHLAAILDAEATKAGMGDTGGVATLLPRLGAALAAQPRIGEVITIGRGMPDAPATTRSPGQPAIGGHHFDNVPLEAGEGASFAGRLALARGRRAGHPSRPARQRHPRRHPPAHGGPGQPGGRTCGAGARIPIVFTLAPDPHGPMAVAERSGMLDRRSFAAQDARAALWYRADLVAGSRDQARELVLFPRPDLSQQLAELMGFDLADGPSAPHRRRRGRRHATGRRGVGSTHATAGDAPVVARPASEPSAQLPPAPSGPAHRRQRRSPARGQGHGPYRGGLRTGHGASRRGEPRHRRR